MAKVKLARGTQSAYNALASKDSDTLYFCTDSHNIYLGSTLLFEPNAYVDASLSNKVVTFTTHGTNGTTGTDTLDLGVFQTASEVSSAISTAIATAISSVYKPAGTIAKSGIVSGLLVEANQGNVYNVSEAFTVGSGSVEVPASLFTDAAAGHSYPAGTNIVVVNTGTSASPVYKFDVLAGFVDLSNYVTKVSGATAGNFAALDANGNVVDSGVHMDDVMNVQSDWEMNDEDDAAFILNKPTIPSATSDLTNDSGFITSADVPSPADAAPIMDGTATVGTSTDYAREDHVHPSDTSRVPTTRTVNGKALSSNITLSASDVGALPSSTTIPTVGTLDTTAATAQTTSSSESLEGNVTLHKVSKTGDYGDLLNKPTIPDVSGKADKVSGATNGNLAGLDSSGNLTDSGKKSSDFATSAQGTEADTIYANYLKAGNDSTIVTTPSFNPESDTVHVTPQTLSSAQKAQARENIGAQEDVNCIVNATSQQDGTVVLTKANGDTITIDLNHQHPNYYSKVAETAQPSGGMLPDVTYKLGTLTGATTFSFAAAVSGNLNHYYFVFTSGSTAVVPTWPAIITSWDGNCVDSTTGLPVIAASKTYEVSVIDGNAIIKEW